MTQYHGGEELAWETVDVRGAEMQKAVVWEGAHDVRSAFFRMPAGLEIPDHSHTKWVQVMVLEGVMRVEQRGVPPREISAGGVYFVTPGENHVETAVEDCLVLVTQGEDRADFAAAS